MTAWAEVSVVTPSPADYRARCTNKDCEMYIRPAEFSLEEVASTWAQHHANRCGVPSVVERRA